jgi:hypothetical protein
MAVWHKLGDILGYVECVYEPGAQRRNLGEIVGYVEYVGDAAGSYTPDIATVGEIIGYVEYEDLLDIIAALERIYGPLIWMT